MIQRILVLTFMLAIPSMPASAKGALTSAFEGRWDVTVLRTDYQPKTCRALLVLTKRRTGWTGSVTFRVLMNGTRLPLEKNAFKEDRISFRVVGLHFTVDARLMRKGLRGTCVPRHGARYEFRAEKLRVEPVPLFEKGLRYGGDLKKGDARKLDLDIEGLHLLVGRAANLDTDALLVMKDGKVVCERTFGRPGGPIPTMSVTKFVTALAAGALLEDGKIKSLDEPVSRWYPEWKEGERGRVTLRHLLTHTSGIAHGPNARELNAQDDRVGWVLGHAVKDPGKKWSYNNDAVALLSGILGMAAKKPVDEFVKERIFSRISVGEFRWNRDTAGNTVTYAELWLTARDLARVGRLVADGGKAGRKKVLSRKTIELLGGEATKIATHQGLLWFRILNAEKRAIGWRHDGWLGQHLVVFPKEKLVGVRLRRGQKRDLEGADFGEFTGLLQGVLRD